jgi:endogenous inhibitor of DNA gyrase (YacG/DUF329 family)
MRAPTFDEVAEVLALADPATPWWYKGPVRHRVRVILLSIRWTRSWHRADLEARRLVANGRLKNGVRMPTGWDVDTDLASWMGTADCPICDRTFLTGGRQSERKYCSEACRATAGRIRRRQAVLPPGPVRCARCNEVLTDDYNGRAKFCSARCRMHAYLARKREVTLTDREFADRRCAAPGCDNPVPTHDPRAKYCSSRCRHTVSRILKAARAGSANGHANRHDADHATNGSAPPVRPGPVGGTPGIAEDRAGAGPGPHRTAELDAARAAT